MLLCVVACVVGCLLDLLVMVVGDCHGCLGLFAGLCCLSVILCVQVCLLIWFVMI